MFARRIDKIQKAILSLCMALGYWAKHQEGALNQWMNKGDKAERLAAGSSTLWHSFIAMPVGTIATNGTERMA
ncbi:MAG: hypothetical protein Q4A11_06085 [Brachymonas sp.]|nr:hypothetical protein [Brachymonas sp.]